MLSDHTLSHTAAAGWEAAGRSVARGRSVCHYASLMTSSHPIPPQRPASPDVTAAPCSAEDSSGPDVQDGIRDVLQDPGQGARWSATTTAAPQPELPPLREIIPRPMDWKVLAILVMTCLVLTACKYFGGVRAAGEVIQPLLSWLQLDQASRRLAEAVDSAPASDNMRIRTLRLVAAAQDRLNYIFDKHPRRQLWQHYYWVIVHLAGYVLVPALLIRFAFKERLSDYGLKLTAWHRLWWIYLAGLAVVLPLVLLCGRSASFLKIYPFYKQAGESWFDFLGWEIAYGLQFLGLEFFFRGVLIHGLKHRLGWYAVPVMTVPYCMIHFGKPLPETLGAIFAGLFLGTVSLWTRSIWLGTALHISVAVSMDLAALYYKGQL
jgi:membrane protease YdiL (CAAX protease family)